MADDLTLTAILNANASGMVGGFQQAIQSMNGFKSAASVAGGGLKEVEAAGGSAGSVLGAVVPVVAAIGAAAIGVGIAATKMAADYQQSMNKVQALTGTSTDQMNQYDASLKQLSMDTGVAPRQLADGLYNVVSAGYQGKDAMTLLGLATKDSVIGMTDAGTTTKSLTALLAQFGLGAKDATRVNGEMLETVTLGSGTFEQYASSIVKSASSASQFGVSLETMNAAYATLTSSQINAAQASTDFQQSLKVMYGNIGTVTTSLQKNGIAFDEAKFNTLDYGGKVQMLNSALEEANAKHVKVTGVTLQAAQAIHTIATHIDTYNTDLKKLSDQQAMAAKTQEAWNITVQGFNVSLQRLKATAQVVMIDLGQHLLPIATAAVNGLNTALQKVMDAGHYVGNVLKALNLSEFRSAWTLAKDVVHNLEQALKAFGARINPIKGDFDPFADAINNLAKGGLKILTKLLEDASYYLTNLTRYIQNAKDPMSELGTAVKNLTKPFQDISNLIKNELGKELKDIGDDAKQIGDWFKNSVVPALKQAEPGFKALGDTLLNNVAPAVVKVRSDVVDVIQNAFNKLAPIIERIVPPLIKFAGTLANDLSNGLKIIMPDVRGAADAIGQFANQIIDRVAPIINNVLLPGLRTLYSIWQVIWPGIANTLRGVWDAIVGIVQIGWGLVKGIILIGLDILSMNWKQAWTDMWQMVQDVWNGTQRLIGGAWDAIKGIVQTMVQGIVGFFTWLWHELVGGSIIPDMVNGIVSWIAQLPGRVGAIISQLVTNVYNSLATMVSTGISQAIAFVSGIVGQVSQTASQVGSALASVPGTVTSALSAAATAAYNAGSKIVSSIADAIRAGIGVIGNAMSAVTSWVTAHLPASPAKVGPLRNLAYQGSQIPEQISQGMIAGIPRIQSALNRITTPIALNFQYPTPGVASGGAPVIHVHVNSQAPAIYLDGREITKGLEPHISNKLRMVGNVRAR